METFGQLMEKAGNHKLLKDAPRAEGADPKKVAAGDGVWFLREGEYRRPGKRDWRDLVGGEVKLQWRLGDLFWFFFLIPSAGLEIGEKWGYKEKKFPRPGGGKNLKFRS